MISSNDISVIVQGAIDKKETKKCLKSVRKHLPNAEIILSTWEGSDTERLDYDVLVLNKDPGAVIFTTGKNKVYNNLNRQLLSVQNGLKKANRKYVLKLRSDLILTNSSFLNYFDKYQKRCDEYKLFERKIIVPALYSRKFIYKGRKKKYYAIPFHPSDFFYFGLNQDIKTFFTDTPLQKEPEYSNYFYQKENRNKDKAFNVAMYQYPPEQYLALSCFQKHFSDIKMKDYADVNFINIRQSEIAMINNFIILEYKQHGIYMNKYKQSKNEKIIGEIEHPGLYSNFAYFTDYKKYCDNAFELPLSCWWDKIDDVNIPIARFTKHVFRFLDNKTSMLKKAEEMFIGIPFTLANLLFRFIRYCYVVLGYMLKIKELDLTNMEIKR